MTPFEPQPRGEVLSPPPTAVPPHEVRWSLVTEVAGDLTAGREVDVALSRVAALILSRLGARGARIWVREPHGTLFWSIAAPPDHGRREVASLADLPAPPEGVLRHDLRYGGERLGLLEVNFPTVPPGMSSVLQVVADVVSPFVAGQELSADLASEVAVRTREVEEQRLVTSLIIDSLPVGLYVVDRDYRIQIWNRKRETGTQGLRRDEVVGRPVFEVLTRQPAAQLKAEFDEVFATGEIRQVEMEVAGKEPRFFRISKIPMCLGGDQVTHVITIGEDVTEWHDIQHRIMQSEKLAAVGQLAAGVMHEINNPLATIGACVAAIQGRLGEIAGPARESLSEYADIIDKEVERCTGIVDGLLDFSRPKGKAKKPSDVAVLLEDTLFLLKHHTRFKKLAVQRQFTPGLTVDANAEQLIQVFMALMLNALDAMEQTGVRGTLTVRTRRHPLRASEAVIEFQDTGVGIPRSELPKIFEPFYTTKPHGRGTGLGLSICYGIVEDHRGRLDAESQLGLGSTFRITLPLVETPPR